MAAEIIKTEGARIPEAVQIAVCINVWKKQRDELTNEILESGQVPLFGPRRGYRIRRGGEQELGTVLMNEIEYGILKHLNMFPCFVRKVKRVFAILVKSGKNFRVLGEK